MRGAEEASAGVWTVGGDLREVLAFECVVDGKLELVLNLVGEFVDWGKELEIIVEVLWKGRFGCGVIVDERQLVGVCAQEGCECV